MKKIFSLQNPLVKQLCKLHDKHFRDQHQQALLYTQKVIEPLAKHLTITAYVVPENKKLHASAPVYQASQNVLEKIAALPSFNEMIAVVDLTALPLWNQENRVIILDAVSDPGNVGAIIRSAVAFGFDGVILLEKCADPFSDKVIRASKGAVFQIPLLRQSTQEFLTKIKTKEPQVILADCKGQDCRKHRFLEKTWIVFGNEGHGFSPLILNAGFETITIPVKQQMESLNVAAAAAILMYEMSHG